HALDLRQRLERNVTCSGRNIQKPPALRNRRLLDNKAPPAPVKAARHDPVHQVITWRNPRKNVTHGISPRLSSQFFHRSTALLEANLAPRHQFIAIWLYRLIRLSVVPHLVVSLHAVIRLLRTRRQLPNPDRHRTWHVALPWQRFKYRAMCLKMLDDVRQRLNR